MNEYAYVVDGIVINIAIFSDDKTAASFDYIPCVNGQKIGERYISNDMYRIGQMINAEINKINNSIVTTLNKM